MSRQRPLLCCVLLVLVGCNVVKGLPDAPSNSGAEREPETELDGGLDPLPVPTVATPQQPPVGETSESSLVVETPCQAPFCQWLTPDDELKCLRAQLPQEESRPTLSAPDSEELAPFFVAFERLWLGESPLPGSSRQSKTPWYTWGFDLDGYCTSVEGCGGGTSSKRLGCVQQGSGLPVDSAFCADNMFSQLHVTLVGIARSGAAYGLTEAVLNCGLQHGDYNQLLRISGYNGQPDDDRVRLDFYASPGMEARSEGWQCPVDDLPAQPSWFASSRWLIAQESLQKDSLATGAPATGLPDSRIAVEDAFVVDRYLVGRLPEYSLLLPGEHSSQPLGWRVELQQAWIVGQLVQRADDTWAIEGGALSGRQPVAAIKERLHELGLCATGETATTFRQIASYLKHFADVSLQAEAEDVPCDAISTSIGFIAAQVEAGEVVQLAETADCCANADSDQCQAGACGNGVLDVGESCDPLIGGGDVGSCPSSCPPDAETCEPMSLVEAGCQTRCEMASGATSTPGQSAEPAVGEAAPCDAGMECDGSVSEVTGEVRSGPGDAAAPVEDGQECSPAAEGACVGEDCASALPVDACEAAYATVFREQAPEECAACACSDCNSWVASCLVTVSAEDAELCTDLMRCVLASSCIGIDCYVGECQPAAAAAGRIPYWPGPDPVLLIGLNDTSTPLGVSSMLDRCLRDECAEACDVAPPRLPPAE